MQRATRHVLTPVRPRGDHRRPEDRKRAVIAIVGQPRVDVAEHVDISQRTVAEYGNVPLANRALEMHRQRDWNTIRTHHALVLDLYDGRCDFAGGAGENVAA